ncbi:DNA replication and repair protein RecF [bacterium]|nr:DNA replication and repair protein RecF [bacterium]
MGVCGNADAPILMFIRRITLRHYRNFQNLDIELPKGIILLKGGNAQGKSNFLEALHFLSSFKSPKAKEDADLITKGSKRAYIRGEVAREGRIFVIESYISEEGKIVKVDYKFRKVGEAMGKCVTILYRDEDKEIIIGEPSARRDFLDEELSLIFPRYRDALSSFRKVLAQRNALLKTEVSSQELEPWNQEFAQLSSQLISIRERFLADILPYFQRVHSALTEGEEKPYLEYVRTTGESVEEILDDLKRYEEEEREKGMSLVGPQRDDVLIRIDSMDARYFSSLGQVRTLALSLRLAQLFYLKNLLGEYPVFLLDDLSSDLEERRRRKIGEILKGVEQVFIATTQRELFPFRVEREIAIYKGSVIENRRGNY